MRALRSFTVRHSGIHLRVKVYATSKELTKLFRGLPGKTDPTARGACIQSFYRRYRAANRIFSGEIYLLATPKLYEYVPHEVTHAVLDYFESPVCSDDTDEEEFATAIGLLSAKIFKEVLCYAN